MVCGLWYKYMIAVSVSFRPAIQHMMWNIIIIIIPFLLRVDKRHGCADTMAWIALLLCICLAFVSEASALVLAGVDERTVTCGSVIKLVHQGTGNTLHSHAIAWGSGSGQQSVTCTKAQNDAGSLWLIKDASTATTVCEIGTPVKCGSNMRLEHIQTGKNLHSHLFRAPISGNQEVSGFGEAGTGDTGDNWTVICDGGESYWQRNAAVNFMHVDTSKLLYTSEKVKFTAQNCGQGCPIMDQTEVSVSSRKDPMTKFYASQGVYFPATAKKDVDGNDEL